jgi:hypothetical protein
MEFEMLREDILFKGGTLGNKTLRSKLPKNHCVYSPIYDETGNPIGYEKYDFRRAGPLYVFDFVGEQQSSFNIRQVPVAGTIGKDATESVEAGKPEQQPSKPSAGSEEPASPQPGQKRSVRGKGKQK